MLPYSCSASTSEEFIDSTSARSVGWTTATTYSTGLWIAQPWKMVLADTSLIGTSDSAHVCRGPRSQASPTVRREGESLEGVRLCKIVTGYLLVKLAWTVARWNRLECNQVLGEMLGAAHQNSLKYPIIGQSLSPLHVRLWCPARIFFRLFKKKKKTTIKTTKTNKFVLDSNKDK